MGGDDLGDDDAYLLAPVVAESDDEIDESIKRPHLDDEDDTVDEDDDSAKEPSPKKRKKLNHKALLIQAGCGIESSPVKDQLSFLSTSLKHYTMLAAKGGDGDKPTNFLELKERIMATSSKDSLLERLRDIVSMKKLKKHKESRSPAVVVVCQSARRAVAILKELNGLRLRAIKLFPKSGETQQQVTQLRQNSYPLAVGTPHRLVALCGHPKGLTFEHTHLVVLDTFVSNKQFTVCTLPDTSADTMGLLRDHVLPQTRTNKNLRVAFL